MDNKKQILIPVGEKRSGDAFITILRAVACLLIINSHCREIYPYYFLAVGGGHGNAIFFVVSGYCLARISCAFPQWYGRRVKRILPVTVTVMLLGMLLEGKEAFIGVPVSEIVLRYLNRYWFVCAILIYYCVFYKVFYKGNAESAKIALTGYFLGYVALYIFLVDKTVFSVELEGFSLFKVYFYFGVFLVGGLIRLWQDTYPVTKRTRKWFLVDLAVIMLSGIIWCVEYALVMVLNTGLIFQFLIHLSIFAFSVAVLYFGLYVDQFLHFPEGRFGRIIRKIASSTLEIYLVQVTIQPYLPKMAFPLNWFLFVGVALIGGVVVQEIFSYMAKNLSRRSRS